MQDLEILFKKVDDYKLTGRDIYCGRLWGLLIFRFEIFKSEILDHFSKKLSETRIQDTIFDTFKKHKSLELKSLLDNTLDNQDFYKYQIRDLEYQLKNILCFQDFFDFIYMEMKKYSFYQDEFLKNNNVKQEEFFKYYPLFKCFEVLYSDFKIRESREKILKFSANDKIREMYQKIGIDLKDDKNFDKYGLKTFEKSHMSIFCDKDNQLLIDDRIDKEFKKFFSILFNKRILLDCLNYLFCEEKVIGELSFRIDSITENSFLLLEEFDFGTKLKTEIDNLPKISKFYNLETPKDNLWIFHDSKKKQIVFEELCDDFELLNDDVVTQIVHLEYQKIDSKYFITHIDHEYIIYTFDEYENRLSNNEQKGYKKVKTFKVDNAKIPFFYQYEHYQNCYESGNKIAVKDYFLFIVLDSFFEHKELLKEYFEDVNKE